LSGFRSIRAHLSRFDMTASNSQKPDWLSRLLGKTMQGPLPLFLLLVAFVGGIVALMITAREEEPQIIVPMADVLVAAPGLSAQQVERQIVIFDEKFIIGHPLPNTDYNDCFDLDVLPQLAQISFTDAISGMPKKAIKKCEHEKKCGNYFLHLSEKPKYYCSPKCTSRALAQERRDAEKMAEEKDISVEKAREEIKKRKAQKRKEGKNGN